MTTNQKVNAEILEKVMGCSRPEPITRALEDDHLPIRRNGWTWIDARGEWVSFRNYLTDIAAAMEVVGKLGEEGWTIKLRFEPTAPESLRWCADFFKRNDTDSCAMELSDTLPEAICLAALKTQDTNALAASGTTDQVALASSVPHELKGS